MISKISTTQQIWKTVQHVKFDYCDNCYSTFGNGKSNMCKGCVEVVEDTKGL